MLTFIDFIATFSPLVNRAIYIHGGCYVVSWEDNVNYFAFCIRLSNFDSSTFGADVVSGVLSFAYNDSRFRCRDVYLSLLNNQPCLIAVFDK